MRSHIILILILVVLNPLNSSGQLGDSISSKIDSLLHQLEKDDVFSGSVLIGYNGSIVYSKHLGYSTKEKHLRNTSNTKFYIGSITKLYTKILIYQLVEEKKIKLNDKVAKYLSGFNKNVANHVTVQHLLNHTSGLGQYYDHPEFESRKKNISSIDDILYFVKTEELMFKPGTEVEYSNSGYVVLGAIIEKVTNLTYGEALKSYIFQKIDARNSSYSIINTAMDSTAQGYLTNLLTGATNADLFLTGASDGGIITTAYDLFKLDSAIFQSDIVLNEKSRLQIFNQRGNNELIATSKNVKFAIAGGDPGLSTIYSRNIVKGYTIIVLSNYDEPVSAEVLRSVVNILNGNAPSKVIGSIARHLRKYMNEHGGASFKTYLDQNIDDQLVALRQNDMPLLYLGKYLIENERLFDAQCLYEIYTKHFPKIVIAWEELALVYTQLNKTSDANFIYLKLQERFPENEEYRQNIIKPKTKN